MERADPDPAWASAEVKELLDRLDPDESAWFSLIRRYGRSRSAAVVTGLAGCLAEDAEREQPRAGIEVTFRLIASLSISDPNLLHMCLVALAKQTQDPTQRACIISEAELLYGFILACFDYRGEGEFVVRISLLALLDSLEEGGLLKSFLDGERFDRVRERLLAARDSLDGPYAEQADRLLDLVESYY